MWVIYNIWKYTPLGLMWTSHGNFFVNGGPTKKEKLLKSFRQHLTDYFWSWDYRWVVMYPEGSFQSFSVETLSLQLENETFFLQGRVSS